MPRPAALWREGHEFESQSEAAKLGDGAEAVVARVPEWVWLVMETLRELRLQEMTGTLRDGAAWGEQAAWKVELWEAYWWGRLQARAARECERW